MDWNQCKVDSKHYYYYYYFLLHFNLKDGTGEENNLTQILNHSFHKVRAIEKRALLCQSLSKHQHIHSFVYWCWAVSPTPQKMGPSILNAVLQHMASLYRMLHSSFGHLQSILTIFFWCFWNHKFLLCVYKTKFSACINDLFSFFSYGTNYTRNFMMIHF